MSNKKALGILFANMHDNLMGDLTKHRSMASLPIGGRYRMIDFALSALVAADITRVGVIAKTNYQSLMDHLGSGIHWDLSRKNSGLVVFPPHGYSDGNDSVYHGRIQALWGVRNYIESAPVSNVILMDCDHVANIDVKGLLAEHERTGADVTMLCYDSDDKVSENSVILKTDGGKVVDMMIGRMTEGCVQSMNVFVINKAKLLSLLADAMSHMLVFFERDVLLANIDTLNIRCHMHEGYVRRVYSLKSYYDINMDMLKPEVTAELFTPERPILTKVRDEAPVRYGLKAEVKNCFVADGCVIEGRAENCVLFRGATVKAGARIKDSIVMQASEIGEDADLAYIITDKSVKVSDGCVLRGHESYPLYLKKYSTV